MLRRPLPIANMLERSFQADFVDGRQVLQKRRDLHNVMRCYAIFYNSISTVTQDGLFLVKLLEKFM